VTRHALERDNAAHKGGLHILHLLTKRQWLTLLRRGCVIWHALDLLFRLEAAQMRLRLPHHSRRVFSAMHLTCMGPSTAPVPRGAFLQTGQACQRVIGQWPLLVQRGFARQRWLLRPRG
jgi:hypothetical protein